MSRTFNENSERKLSPFLFQSILQRFQFIADIDLFASHLNRSNSFLFSVVCLTLALNSPVKIYSLILSNYVSWLPDPETVGVDAFNTSWAKLKFYTFSPSSLVAKSISKIIQEKVSGIMVIPWWPT